MNRTKLINIKKTKNWDISIMRRRGTPHHFGNPFIMGVDGDRDEVCDKHDSWLRGTDFTDFKQQQRTYVLSNLWNLEGKRIACCCTPERCHGDNYIKILKEERKILNKIKEKKENDRLNRKRNKKL